MYFSYYPKHNIQKMCPVEYLELESITRAIMIGEFVDFDIPILFLFFYIVSFSYSLSVYQIKKFSVENWMLVNFILTWKWPPLLTKGIEQMTIINSIISRTTPDR